jgi:hypothetical protein
MKPPAPLRVGVLLDGPVVPAWVASLLEDLVRADTLDVTALPVEAGGRKRSLGRGSRLARVLYKLYRGIDRRVFDTGPDPLEPTGVPAGLTAQEESTQREPLDVVVVLSPGAEQARVASLARFGAWSIAFEGAPWPDEDLAPFWRMTQGQATVSVAVLATIAGADQLRVVRRAVAACDAVSLGRTEEIYWKASRLLARDLDALARSGGSLSQEELLASDAVRPNVPSPLSARVVLLHLLRVSGRAVRSRLRKTIWREQWFVAYRVDDGIDPVDPDLNGFSSLESPDGHFFADPFPIEFQGRNYVFFEDFVYAEKRAVISVVELREDAPSPPRVALACDYHLSYPFLFRMGEEVFMIPETASNRTVELYRALEFPDRWEKSRVLLSGIAAYDATIIEHEARLWLFASVEDRGSRGWDELAIFSASSLEGPWQPHPRNPVVADIRSARPAGQIFRDGGRLIRPAQDCAGRYGHAIVFKEIGVLTETDYRERALGDSTMLRGAWRTHSYNAAGGYAVVDGSRLVPRLPLVSRSPERFDS